VAYFVERSPFRYIQLYWGSSRSQVSCWSSSLGMPPPSFRL
jgi:hypothetical protein